MAIARSTTLGYLVDSSALSIWTSCKSMVWLAWYMTTRWQQCSRKSSRRHPANVLVAKKLWYPCQKKYSLLYLSAFHPHFAYCYVLFQFFSS